MNIIKNDTITDVFNYAAKFLSLNSNQQLRFLLFADTINATSEFMNRETLADLGYFDERYFGMEDYPLWVKATNSGYKLYGFNEVTCNYRLHDTNFSLSDSVVFKKRMHKDLLKFYWSEIIVIGIKKLQLACIIYIITYTLISFIIIILGNKKNKVSELLLRFSEFVKSAMIKIARI